MQISNLYLKLEELVIEALATMLQAIVTSGFTRLLLDDKK